MMDTEAVAVFFAAEGAIGTGSVEKKMGLGVSKRVPLSLQFHYSIIEPLDV